MFVSIWNHRRIIFLTAVIELGTALIGYDAGVYGSVLVMPSFVTKFDFESNPLRAANLGGNTVEVYYLGALVSTIFVTPCSIWFGRRNCLFASAFGLVLGGILQTISQTITIIYLGRSLGMGCSGFLGPMYLAECATREHRTVSVSSIQLSVVLGAFISYWIGYGVSHDATSDFQWRFLLGFQVVLACLFFLGIFFVPESPRHLAYLHVQEEARRRRQGLLALPRFPSNHRKRTTNEKVDSDSKSVASDSPHAGIDTLDFISAHSNIAHTLADRMVFGCTGSATALSTLAYLRCLPVTSEAVLDECAEIYAAVDETEAQREADGGVWNALMHKKGSFFRLFIVLWLGAWQANTGQLVLLTYAPTVLKSLGLSSTKISLVASGGFTTWEARSRVACVAFAVFYGLKKIGRVTAFTIGGIWLGLIFFMLAAIEATHPVDPLATSPSNASYAMVFLIYLFVPGFCIFLGPTFWLYGSECCTGSLRELGQCLFIEITWVFCVVGGKVTPIGLVTIGWKFWIVPAAINFAFGLAAWRWLPETKDKSIEEMDILFGAIDETTRTSHIQQVLRDEKAAVESA
ncbi:hypothetical protein FRB96_006178 [Tulasnella sp. 330]|nr:hypothetical protein FRB96_006178 [Tulasnella sp. 330]